MILAVDIMGFENPIEEAIKACRKFVKKNKNIEIILVGNKEIILKHFKKNDEFKIENALDVISMDDNPLFVRNRKESSMYKAIKLVADEKADGVLSAGSTACYVTLTYLLLKKIPKISKIGFMPWIPTRYKQGFNLLDCGANKVVTANDLVDFAIMSDLYCRKVRKIENPKIGLINIGVEEDKGLDYIIEANKILKDKKDINYIGFVEPRYLLEEVLDIAICDGFTGNIVLKTLEGTAKSFGNTLLDEFKKPTGWFGFIFSFPSLIGLKKKFDYKNNAGAFVIGLNKIALKTHGSADYKQFYSSLRMLKETIDSNVLKDLKEIV